MVRRILLLGCLLAACGGDASSSDHAADDQDGSGDGLGDGDGDGDGADEQPGDGDGDGDGAADAADDGDADDAELDADGGVGDGDGDDGPGALSECAGGSIDRLQSWQATHEGTMVPDSGSILVQEGDDWVGRVEWLNAEWHVVPVLATNSWEQTGDFTNASGFWLTYSATSRFYVQLRPGFAWDGGNKYLVEIPSTGGAVETHFFSFAADSWTTLSALGTPDYPFAEALADVRGFVFVGDTPNVIAFSGLRVDGFEPPCL